MSLFLFFVTSPIGRLLAVALVCTTLGATGGYRLHKKFSDAAALRAVTTAYQNRIKRMEADAKAVTDAAHADQARAADEESKRVQAEERANALEAKVADGVCLDAGDVDGLRQLWSSDASGAQRKSAARAK